MQVKNYAADVKCFFIFLFTDGILIDENNYLETLPIWTKLLICKKEELNKILYFLMLKTDRHVSERLKSWFTLKYIELLEDRI